MAKAYRLNRNGGTDTFTDINNDSKVKHYASDNAAEADIANLEVGQIISTPDEHDFGDLINQITTAEQNALDAIDAAESVSVATVTDEGTVQENRLSGWVNDTGVPTMTAIYNSFKSELKSIVAASSDFADFKTRIGAW